MLIGHITYAIDGYLLGLSAKNVSAMSNVRISAHTWNSTRSTAEKWQDPTICMTSVYIQEIFKNQNSQRWTCNVSSSKLCLVLVHDFTNPFVTH